MAGQSEHIFLGHLLGQIYGGPSVRTYAGEVWPSVLLVLCLCILALVKLRAYPRVVRIVQSTFSNQILQQLEREEVNTFRFYSIALNFFFIINLAFLTYKLNQFFALVFQGIPHFLQFCYFMLLITLVVVIKITVNRLLVVFTGERRLIQEYQISSMLINQTFGLFLFPWLVLLEFGNFQTQPVLWLAVTVAASSVMIKWYRGLMMGVAEERIGLLQIFSYFCGLEILPVLVLVKYIIETF